MNQHPILPALAAFFFALLAAPPARAVETNDVCFVAAQAVHKQHQEAQPSASEAAAPACFVESARRFVALDNPTKPCVGAAKKIYAAKQEALAGFSDVQRLNRPPGGKCRELFAADFGPGGVPPGAGAPPDAPAQAPGRLTPDDTARVALRMRAASDDAVALVHDRLLAPSPSLGGERRLATLTASALPDAAAEALQILGQIVVDRASQAGYRLASEKARRGLACGEGDTPNPATDFPATCETLRTLRVQDIAMSRDVLVRALASDIASLALKPYAKPAFAQTPTGALLSTATAASLGAVSDAGSQRKATMARALADELLSLAQSAAAAKAGLENVAPELKPVVLAAGAIVACQLRAEAGDLARLASCDVSREVDRLASGVKWSPDEARAPAVARSIARSVQIALEGFSRDESDKPASTQRAIAALAGVFDATCYAVERDDPIGCPAVLDLPADHKRNELTYLAVARGALEAALEQDTNRLIASIGRGLELLTPAAAAGTKPDGRREMLADRRRALRLLAGLAQYAQTFAEKEQTAEQKHARRTKILESLTADMTDRSGREGDRIWSLGGSLALVGAARVPGFGGEGGAVASGPLALTLGGAYQNVPKSGAGLHVELGVVDLAQYLSFRKEADGDVPADKTAVVRKPSLPDALAPSLKVGLQWGREVPIYLAGFAQYAPFYEFEKKNGGDDRHGSIVFGLALGAYVPLLDSM